MGIDDSPLHAHVVFIIGAARSGTTWFASMLTAHPGIAGANESHLFDWGVDHLFDNVESPTWEERFLASYLTRSELVGLVRGLCDGVFLRMRYRWKPAASFIVEKTPFSGQPEAELRRKLDCYPDAWYIHLLRDPRAVARSSRGRWATSVEQTALEWTTGVRAVRTLLAGHPRFLELRYEDLVAAPLETTRNVFNWMGVPADDQTDDLVNQAAQRQIEPRDRPANASAERWRRDLSTSAIWMIERASADVMNDLGYELVRPPTPWRWRATQSARRLVRTVPFVRRTASALRELGRSRGNERPPEALIGPADELLAKAVQDFSTAFSTSDETALRALVTPGCEVKLRMGAEEQTAAGDEGLHALLTAGSTLFRDPFVAVSWFPSLARPVSTVWFSGQRITCGPVDFALALGLDGSAVTHVELLAHASPAGAR